MVPRVYEHIEVPKHIQAILENNLKVDRNRVDGYVLYCNKHIPGDPLHNKYQLLERIVVRLGGEITRDTERGYINGNDYCRKIIIRLKGVNKELLTYVR